jgi:hypothetical protein
MTASTGDKHAMACRELFLSRVKERRPLRVAAWIAAWLACAGVYATLVYTQSMGSMHGPLLIRVALETTLAPLGMSVAVWRTSGLPSWNRRRPISFAGLQLGLALAFSLVWAAWMFLVARIGPGSRMSSVTLIKVVLPWHVMTGGLVYGVIAACSFAYRYQLRARDLSLASEHAERLRVQAELTALRAHIDPHFLFNTLHSVSELLEGDPTVARIALEQLAELFRYTLRLDRARLDLVSLDDEWMLVQRYLWLERLRMGERLCVVHEIDDEVLDCAIPPYTVQPIIENAVRHGLGPSPRGGLLIIRAHEVDARLVVEIEDDGCGLICDPNTSRGLGLRSVRQRLAARFGAAATITIAPRVGGGTRVVVSLPAEPLA